MFTHPKKRRLLKRIEFKRLFSSRQRFNCQLFSIEYNLRKDLTHPRLGITITKQYGKANCRNLFKRRIKEIFRNHTQELNFGIDLNVRAKSQHPDSFDLMVKEFQTFLSHLQK